MISYPRQIGVDAGRLVGDGDNREKAEIYARRNAFDVDPERHPRQYHRQDAWKEHLYDVIANLSL